MYQQGNRIWHINLGNAGLSTLNIIRKERGKRASFLFTKNTHIIDKKHRMQKIFAKFNLIKSKKAYE